MLEDIIKKWGGSEVSAMDVYTDIFKLGEGYIQKNGEAAGEFKANPVGYYRKRGATKGAFRVFFEDTFEETLQELQEADGFCIINGITYFGRKNLQEHASKMYAMIFDLDGVTDSTLNNFFSGCGVKAYPLPNYVALSGHGVHLYYVFEEPVSLFPYTKIQLKELKFALTTKIWNMYTSTIEKPQQQGINQGFRAIGGHTKVPGVRVRAFRVNTHPYSLSELCEFVPDEHRIDETKIFKESKITLQQAKKKYPEWYERVVVNKENSRKKWDIPAKVNGDNPYALYDWWIRKIYSGASYGHRYFAIMCLAIYGAKCGKTYEEVKSDAFSLIPFMNGLNEEKPFTEHDCLVALECFDDRYCTFPIRDIEKISGIPIEKNKRNGRKQKTHLRLARSNRDILCEERGKNDWREGNGRPDKALIVQRWIAEHPGGKKADCIRETGLSKPTVYKWWNE